MPRIFEIILGTIYFYWNFNLLKLCCIISLQEKNYQCSFLCLMRVISMIIAGVEYSLSVEFSDRSKKRNKNHRLFVCARRLCNATSTLDRFEKSSKLVGTGNTETKKTDKRRNAGGRDVFDDSLVSCRLRLLLESHRRKIPKDNSGLCSAQRCLFPFSSPYSSPRSPSIPAGRTPALCASRENGHFAFCFLVWIFARESERYRCQGWKCYGNANDTHTRCSTYIPPLRRYKSIPKCPKYAKYG